MAAKVGLLSLRVVTQQQCNGHCPCDSLCPSTAVETAVAQCTGRWAMARGHRLNTSVVLAAVHGLSGLFRAVSAFEPSLFRPLPPPPHPPVSPSLISHLASVDVKQNVLDSGCTLALAVTDSNQNTSGSDPACLLGYSPSKAIVKHDGAWPLNGWVTVRC